MAHRWTRKRIIQAVLQREAQGLALHHTEEQGPDPALYQAARRLFGSWRNALIAAGITPRRALPAEKWPPGVILHTIRQLARRAQPMATAQLARRHGAMVAAARRTYGSWSKAVIAAGVDPGRFRCVVPWSRDRIIEAILTRALHNEPLGTRSTRPPSLVEAGKRAFGSWAAAKEAAGLVPPPRPACTAADPETPTSPPGTGGDPPRDPHGEPGPGPRGPRKPWTPEMIRASILARLRSGERLNARAVWKDDNRLYRAATRRYGGWDGALRAAGLDPKAFWRTGLPPGRDTAGSRGAGPVSAGRAGAAGPPRATP